MPGDNIQVFYHTITSTNQTKWLIVGEEERGGKGGAFRIKIRELYSNQFSHVFLIVKWWSEDRMTVNIESEDGQILVIEDQECFSSSLNCSGEISVSDSDAQEPYFYRWGPPKISNLSIWKGNFLLLTFLDGFVTQETLRVTSSLWEMKLIETEITTLQN